MSRESLSHAIEDYLKTIHDLTVENEVASTSQIAERLGVTPASVTGMLQKLAATDPPLVVYHKHRGVTLTPDGERNALQVIRHHRLLELFLHQALGYSWDEVDAEADRLEHVISQDFEERMAKLLGDPQHDPHGDPIPTRDLDLPEHSTVSLQGLRAGQRGVVRRVRDTNPDLLRHLSTLDMIPRARFSVLEYSALDGNLHLQVDGREEPVVLGPSITDQIFVEILENSHE